MRLRWSFPEGVPVPVGCDVQHNGTEGIMALPRWWHRECRVLIKQNEPGELRCREYWSGEVGITRRLLVEGLREATVVFFPDTSLPQDALRFNLHHGYHGQGTPVEFRREHTGKVVAGPVTGPLLISW